ncbi:MAG: histidine phosphatase family protein [Rhodospirillales bacterium]|nr:histidine phosphatase family protein [Rhodospirillales bacterium]
MIYLLRHGETVWNVDRRLQGQQDSPLTLRGIAQVRAVTALLGELIADPADFAVVASPLARTWQTASIVCEGLGLAPGAIRFDDRLKEHDFGDWEGLLWAEVERDFPELWAAREADKWNFSVPGGESYAKVAARVGAWLEEHRDGPNLIVVSHGLAGRVLRGLYAGLTQQEVPGLFEPHGSVYRLAGGVVQEFEVEAVRSESAAALTRP